MVAYILKDPTAAVRYVACNLLPKSYVFYAASWVPEGKDLGPIDAKILLTYESHLSKEKQYRRRKAGHASVKYVRCGRLVLLFATKGRSPFFEREDWKDIREAPLHLAGYSLRVDRQTGKVAVRLHKEAQRRIRRAWLDKAACDVAWWERHIRAFPFLPFSGVRDNLFSLVRELNANRKLLRKPPVDWKRCVKKRFASTPVFDESPKEIIELLQSYR